MGIEDMAGKAKDLAVENADKVKEGVDVVAEKVKGLIPEEHKDKLDQATEAVKGLVDKAGSGDSEPSA